MQTRFNWKVATETDTHRAHPTFAQRTLQPSEMSRTPWRMPHDAWSVLLQAASSLSVLSVHGHGLAAHRLVGLGRAAGRPTLQVGDQRELARHVLQVDLATHAWLSNARHLQERDLLMVQLAEREPRPERDCKQAKLAHLLHFEWPGRLHWTCTDVWTSLDRAFVYANTPQALPLMLLAQCTCALDSIALMAKDGNYWTQWRRHATTAGFNYGLGFERVGVDSG